MKCILVLGDLLDGSASPLSALIMAFNGDNNYSEASRDVVSK